MSFDGARSPANQNFLANLLRHDNRDGVNETSISLEDKVEQGLPFIIIHFHLPQAFQPNNVRTIPVRIPGVYIGTGTLQPGDIYSSLIEEMISWMAGLGPKHSIVRLHYNHRLRLPLSSSSGFTTLIDGLRRSQHHFPGLGALGVMEVVQATTSSHDTSGDYKVTLTLSNGRQLSLFIPRGIGVLPFALVLDWIEVQDKFCPD
jgi:hypothetical protein